MVREVHALAVGHLAADNDVTDDGMPADLPDLENQQTVVDQNGISDTDLLGKVLIADRNALRIAYAVIRCKRESITVVQQDLVVFKGTDTVLRSLGVEHDRNGQVQRLADFFD